MSAFINLNGSLLPAEQPVVVGNSPGLRYGVGLFETMRWIRGEVIIAPYHFDRMFAGLELLGFDIPQPFNPEAILAQVDELCFKNGFRESARIRLTTFQSEFISRVTSRANFDYIIESNCLHAETAAVLDKGVSIDIFENGRKSIDRYSNLKSNNYLLYSLSAIQANQQGFDEFLILNSEDRVCETSISNIFYIKNGTVNTPALSEGCIAGTLRRLVLKILTENNIPIFEKPVTLYDLANADEIFLTNAIKGVRWVSRFAGNSYRNSTTSVIRQLVEELVPAFYQPIVAK